MRGQEGSWNVYRDINGSLGLEIETEGDWGPAIPVTLRTLRDHMPVKAAVMLAGFILHQPGDSLLYGDGRDIDEVHGWTLEFSVVRDQAGEPKGIGVPA